MPEPVTIAVAGAEAGAAAEGGASAAPAAGTADAGSAGGAAEAPAGSAPQGLWDRLPAQAPRVGARVLGELLSAGTLMRWLRRFFALSVSLLIAFLLLIAIPILLIMSVLGRSAGASPAGLPEGAQPFVAIYADAAVAWGVNMFVLVALHESESDFSRSTAPGVSSGVNFALCCAGPMQFDIDGGAMPAVGGTGGTWGAGCTEEADSPPCKDGYLRASPGVARPADAPGYVDSPHPNVYDSFDAIYAAAYYLHTLHATTELDDATRQALVGYRGGEESADEVMARAEELERASLVPVTGAAVGGSGAPPLTTVHGITVNTAIAGPLRLMLSAAEADGVTLTGSGYRSSEQQIQLRRQHCGSSQYAIYEMPASSCSPPTARPGTSMHEQGLAIDFAGCDRTSSCYSWLSANAARFGFYNLPSEPWHWSVNGS
jgi:D-alanyl-D-alanine carboxypeptidase